MKKTISIIIATFNAEKYLHRCLNSIILQKDESIELLIIDGKSTDSTLEIIDQYKSFIDYCISEKDCGIYDAWNKGVSKAKGDWIMFLGADDYLLDGAIDKYHCFLKNCNAMKLDLISGKYRYVTEKGKLLGVFGQSYDYKVFCRYMNISHGSSLHNRHLFEELGKFDLTYKVCADYEFLLRKTLKTGFIDEALICMQVGGMSFSYKGLLETYKIRAFHKSVSFIVNVYYLIKGSVGYWFKYNFLGYQ